MMSKAQTIYKVALVPYSAEQMYALLITDFESSPQCMPWCDWSDVVEHLSDGMIGCTSIVDGEAIL